MTYPTTEQVEKARQASLAKIRGVWQENCFEISKIQCYNEIC